MQRRQLFAAGNYSEEERTETGGMLPTQRMRGRERWVYREERHARSYGLNKAISTIFFAWNMATLGDFPKAILCTNGSLFFSVAKWRNFARKKKGCSTSCTMSDVCGYGHSYWNEIWRGLLCAICTLLSTRDNHSLRRNGSQWRNVLTFRFWSSPTQALLVW